MVIDNSRGVNRLGGGQMEEGSPCQEDKEG